MAHPHAFLFDLDGTLAVTLPDITASTNHVRAAYGLPAVSEAEVRGFVGDGARMLLRRALQGRLPEDTTAERAIDDAFAIYAEDHRTRCTAAVTTYPGVREHLEHLRAAGHPLAVVTNKPARFADPIIDHLGLRDLLPVVVGGDTLAVKKPDPAPLRHALDQLGLRDVEPRTVTMVGDGVQDLRASSAFGCRAIACLFGFTPADRLRAEGADDYWTAFGVSAP